MTTTDFQVIANVLNELLLGRRCALADFDTIVNDFTVEFSRVYPRFDPVRFREACYKGLKESVV